MNNISFAREEWKDLHIGEGYTNSLTVQVSNFGRVRTSSDGEKFNILKGSLINGYRIIRLKLFRPRTPKAEEELKEQQKQISLIDIEMRKLKKSLGDKTITPILKSQINAKLDALLKERTSKTKVLQHFLKKETNKRTVNFGGLIHRLVAENFLTKENDDQQFVAHLDHDKLNNVVTNLKWMTREENIAHQQNSPHVIASKRLRKGSQKGGNNQKLTTTKVMFLKKLLNEGKSISSLAKQFRVTETQIIRIKKNENWAHVEAAR